MRKRGGAPKQRYAPPRTWHQSGYCAGRGQNGGGGAFATGGREGEVARSTTRGFEPRGANGTRRGRSQRTTARIRPTFKTQSMNAPALAGPARRRGRGDRGGREVERRSRRGWARRRAARVERLATRGRSIAIAAFLERSDAQTIVRSAACRAKRTGCGRSHALWRREQSKLAQRRCGRVMGSERG